VSDEEFCIETPRLRLRPFRPEDAEDLFRLNSDAEVMRYTGDTPFSDPGAARDFLSHYDRYATDGFGRWAVENRETGEFMGFCGLHRDDNTGVVDLAFRLFRRFWAAGYATEAARASLKAGFERFGLKEIQGRAMRENLPSITVLQKLGMKYRDMIEDGGEFWLVYSVDANRFLEHYQHR
jgi:RimJ/RimL family protein N-acetyltransferase